MPCPASSLMPPRTWTQPGSTAPSSILCIRDESEESFFVSTDSRLMSAKAVNAAFAQDFVYWGQPLPEDVTQKLLDGSLCFGIFRYKPAPGQTDGRTVEVDVSTIAPQQVEQIALARLITDTVTFAYLTDVYVLPEYQSRGLGSWMLECLKTTLYAAGNEGMPYLRRVMLVTTHRDADGGKREDYYADLLGMKTVGTLEKNGFVLSVMSSDRKRNIDQPV